MSFLQNEYAAQIGAATQVAQSTAYDLMNGVTGAAGANPISIAWNGAILLTKLIPSTNQMIGRKDKLSIETDVDGRRQDFFNEQDRIHMEDVRKLFLSALKIRTALFFTSPLLIGMLAVKKADVPRLLPVAYKTAMAVLAAAFAFLGISFYIDFTKCFTIFHEIFFTNDLWIFDETTDYMIRMLPEGFFSDMAIRIAAIFAVSLALLGGAVWLVSTAAGRRPFGGIVRLRFKNQR